MPLSLTGQATALVELGRALQTAGYRFTTPTPLTHARVNARPDNAVARDLAGVFGWSRPFERTLLPPSLIRLLDRACALNGDGPFLRSQVRFSTLGDCLFAHSAFPTEGADAVFFGPDSYRFARAIAQLLSSRAAPPRSVVDIGAGTGVGGIVAAKHSRTEIRLILTDINVQALHFAAANVVLNGISNVKIVESDVLDAVRESADLIIANPPYLVDSARRLYRHGGGAWGSDLALRILSEGLDRLTPDGTLGLYSGSAIVNGVDGLRDAAHRELDARGAVFSYEELDPDVFGEELERAPYDTADRIAVIWLTAQAPRKIVRHAA